VAEGLTRKIAKSRDRFEREALAFHRRVRESYLKMATNEPERWLVVDASQSRREIAQIIWQRVSQLLSRG
jgi:dTMP kinase